ncbi:hypothetical protein GHB16_13600 [Enterococcus faecium]|nr:hypothetical protein [Enterococcus faecium]
MIKMKTVNRVFCASHVLSLLLSIYLGVYSIQQPIEVENIVFQMSLTDGLTELGRSRPSSIGG